MFKKETSITALITKFNKQSDKIKKIRGGSNLIIPAEMNIIKQVKKNNSNHNKINDLIRIREYVITNGKTDVRDIYGNVFGLPPLP
jgi:UDP-N-acetylenolpyruvoylglucosamine reductase